MGADIQTNTYTYRVTLLTGAPSKSQGLLNPQKMFFFRAQKNSPFSFQKKLQEVFVGTLALKNNLICFGYSYPLHSVQTDGLYFKPLRNESIPKIFLPNEVLPNQSITL